MDLVRVKYNPDNTIRTQWLYSGEGNPHALYLNQAEKVVVSFRQNVIRTARVYIVLQNLAEADHLYQKHSPHL
jgi:hypothetical protein